MDAETSKQDKAWSCWIPQTIAMQQVLALDSKQFHIGLLTIVIWVWVKLPNPFYLRKYPRQESLSMRFRVAGFWPIHMHVHQNKSDHTVTLPPTMTNNRGALTQTLLVVVSCELKSPRWELIVVLFKMFADLYKSSQLQLASCLSAALASSRLSKWEFPNDAAVCLCSEFTKPWGFNEINSTTQPISTPFNHSELLLSGSSWVDVKISRLAIACPSTAHVISVLYPTLSLVVDLWNHHGIIMESSSINSPLAETSCCATDPKHFLYFTHSCITITCCANSATVHHSCHTSGQDKWGDKGRRGAAFRGSSEQADTACYSQASTGTY